jgi:hypothetical protein
MANTRFHRTLGVGMNVIDILNSLQTPDAKPYAVRASGWLSDDLSADDIEALYDDFGKTFDATVPNIAALLGEPTRSGERDREWLDTWYPEALKFAAWPIPGGFITLALEHQDREVPILLLLTHITDEEIEGRSA